MCVWKFKCRVIITKRVFTASKIMTANLPTQIYFHLDTRWQQRATTPDKWRCSVSFLLQIIACSTRVETRRHFSIHLYIHIYRCMCVVIHYIGYTRDRKLVVHGWLADKIDTSSGARLSGCNSFSRGHPHAIHTPIADVLVVRISTGLLKIKQHIPRRNSFGVIIIL